jgi:DNA invertase Pin-like site-specific DNA recombinase
VQTIARKPPERLAEFETNLRKERQLEGIAKAKEAGVYKGRPASIDAARVGQLKAEGLGPSTIAETLRIGLSRLGHVMDDGLGARRRD